MKTICILSSLFITIGFTTASLAQSTTGGQSGGSTASTGAGYLTPGNRPATSKAASMSINDEGASRGYMYVPPSQRNKGLKKKRAASPDGSGNTAKPAQTGNPAPNPAQKSRTSRKRPPSRN